MSLSISRFGLGLGFALVMAGAGCFATDEDLEPSAYYRGAGRQFWLGLRYEGGV